MLLLLHLPQDSKHHSITFLTLCRVLSVSIDIYLPSPIFHSSNPQAATTFTAKSCNQSIADTTFGEVDLLAGICDSNAIGI